MDQASKATNASEVGSVSKEGDQSAIRSATPILMGEQR